jgi:cell shape-determining protein MreD
MLQQVIANTVRILFLVLLQALVVGRIQAFDGLILPYVYIFGLLMLPFQTPSWLVLFICFVTGWIMDYFTGPVGLHISACVFLGLVVPLVRKFLAPREGYDSTQRPTVQRMGISWYATFASICTFLHHGFLFFLEVLRFSDFFYQIAHIFLSSIATMILMIIGQYIIYNTKTNEQ